MELAPGVVVADRYRLDRRLGKGGMGQVWRATDLRTRGTMALKFLDARLPPGEAQRQLLREATLASRVRHPNVVNVHKFKVLADGTPVMLMDALEGETLRDKLDHEDALPLEVAASVLLPVVSAVRTAHACGVVHRDLKPENILLSPADGGGFDVRVLDFGIAKLMRGAGASEEALATTRTGAVRATALYMSAEQACGDDVDHRTDVWSLGVVMYEVLSGSRPIEGTSYGQILKRLLNDSITPLRVLVPELPEDVLALVDRMLRRHAAARPRDLREVEEVLERYTTVRVGQLSEPRFEAPPPDSSPVSAPHAVVEVEETSDPFAVTESFVASERGPLPVAEQGSAARRDQRMRRAAGASALTLAVCVMVAAWSSWPRPRAPVVHAPVAPTPVIPAPVVPVSVLKPHPVLSDVPPPTASPTESTKAAKPKNAVTQNRHAKPVRTPPGASTRDPQPEESHAPSEPQMQWDPPERSDPPVEDAPRIR